LPRTNAFAATANTLWAVVAAGALGNLILFDILILASPAMVQVAYTPDDGYYYLVLVRNFVHMHVWTFDLGVSRTSGFHPLFAYLLAVLYAICRPGIDGFVRLGTGVSSLLTMVSAAYLIARAGPRRRPAVIACVCALLAVPNVLVNSVSVVEWPLLVLAITLFCSAMTRIPSTLGGQIAIVVIGAAGSLSR
jgi:hypothetical protein